MIGFSVFTGVLFGAAFITGSLDLYHLLVGSVGGGLLFFLGRVLSRRMRSVQPRGRKQPLGQTVMLPLLGGGLALLLLKGTFIGLEGSGLHNLISGADGNTVLAAALDASELGEYERADDALRARLDAEWVPPTLRNELERSRVANWKRALSQKGSIDIAEGYLSKALSLSEEYGLVSEGEYLKMLRKELDSDRKLCAGAQAAIASGEYASALEAARDLRTALENRAWTVPQLKDWFNTAAREYCLQGGNACDMEARITSVLDEVMDAELRRDLASRMATASAECNVAEWMTDLRAEVHNGFTHARSDPQAYLKIIDLLRPQVVGDGSDAEDHKREIALYMVQARRGFAMTALRPADRRRELSEARRLAEAYRHGEEVVALDALIAATDAELAGLPVELPAGYSIEIARVSSAASALVLEVDVRDSHGLFVDHLAAKDFTVRLDGQPVQLLANAFESNPWVNVVFVVDKSGSMSRNMNDLAAGVGKALDALQASRSRVELIAFDDKAYRMVPWTKDLDSVRARVQSLKPGGGTHLLDAAHQAIQSIRGKEGRKAVILFTDGRSQGDSVSLNEVVSSARSAGVALYTIGLRSADYDSKPLEALANATSGQFQEASNVGQLRALFRSLGGKVGRRHYQVLVGSGGTQSSKRIDVQVGGGPTTIAASRSVPHE